MPDHPTQSPYPDLSGQVAVIDGYGVSLSVKRGHLVIRDGIGVHRRERILNRATTPVRRLLILGHAGAITLEALRWCRDASVEVLQIDSHSGLVFTTARRDTGMTRIRRVQALAAYTTVGVEVARLVLGEKLAGQACVAENLPGGGEVATLIRAHAARVEQARSLADAVAAESAAAAAYWQAWATLPVRFNTPDVPAHWRVVGRRTNGLRGSARYAIAPAHSLLNYLYRVLEGEATILLHAAGLDPSLGVWHTDERHRDSLTLDVMEATRPMVEQYVLDLIRQSMFRRCDFYETREGACRILPPLTHHLADAIPILAAETAPIVSRVATLLDRRITPTDPARLAVSRAPRLANTPRRVIAVHDLPALPHCVRCGQPLPPGTPTRINRCDECATIAAARKPRNRRPSPDTQRRREILAARLADTLAWDATHPERADPDEFRRTITPPLQAYTSTQLSRATGLSRRYCQLIRDGERVPHPIHWGAFRSLLAPDAK
jgi:CRISPR-associated protein Cas1